MIEGPDKGLTVTMNKASTMLGRGPVEVQFHDPTVSSVHAIIDYVGNEVYITDQNSSNGTFVNGERVQRSSLANMSEVKLGSTKLLFCMVRDVYGTYMPEQQPAQVQEVPPVDPNAITLPRRDLPNPKLPPDLRVLLYVLDGPDAGRKFLLSKKSTVIGRGQAADIRVNDESVSRRQCQIIINDKNSMGIKDLASTNGTFLNGRPVSALKLSHNDVIELGGTKIRLIIL